MLQEREYGKHFAYVIANAQDIVSAEYKAIKKQKNSHFLPVIQTKHNGVMELFYITTGLQTVQEAILQLDVKEAVALLERVVKTILEVSYNGFLSNCSLIIQTNRLYVDIEQKAVFLTYVPSKVRPFKDEREFIVTLKATLLTLIQEHIIGKQMEIIDILQSEYSQLIDIYHVLESVGRDLNSQQNVTDKLNATKRLILRPIYSELKHDIVVTKPKFVIGKDPNCDGNILLNPAISREHCCILQYDNAFWVEDLNSANGTFVNQERVRINEPKLLCSGDTLCLANNEFKVDIR